MIISSCWCFQYAEQSCHKPWRLSGEGREMPGLQNSFTLIILYEVSSGNILAYLHLKKSIKTSYEICFCFSNFPFFVYSPNSSIFASQLPPEQFWCFINRQAVEARVLQHQPTPTGQLRCGLTSSLPRWLPRRAFDLARSCETPRNVYLVLLSQQWERIQGHCQSLAEIWINVEIFYRRGFPGHPPLLRSTVIFSGCCIYSCRQFLFL